MPAPEALKSFMLLAVLPDNPDPGLRDQLLASDRVTDADRPYLEAIASLSRTGAPPTTNRLNDARDALEAGRYDYARELVDGAERGPRSHPNSSLNARSCLTAGPPRTTRSRARPTPPRQRRGAREPAIYGPLLERVLALASAGDFPWMHARNTSQLGGPARAPRRSCARSCPRPR